MHVVPTRTLHIAIQPCTQYLRESADVSALFQNTGAAPGAALLGLAALHKQDSEQEVVSVELGLFSFDWLCKCNVIHIARCCVVDHCPFLLCSKSQTVHNVGVSPEKRQEVGKWRSYCMQHEATI